MIHQVSQRRLYSSQCSGTVVRCACAFINLLWSNVGRTIARTLKFTFLKFLLPAIHLTIRRINLVHSFHTSGKFCVSIILRRQTNCYDPLFLACVCPAYPLLQESSTGPHREFSAELPPISSRHVSSSNLRSDIEYQSIVDQFRRTLLSALIMTSSIANLLSVDAGAAPSL